MKKIVLLAAFSILISSCEDESFDVNPIAMFTCEVDGYNAIFKNLSGYFEEYAWDFGDGSSATGIAISHVYAAKGEYSVTLTAKTGDKTDVFTDKVTVTGPTIKIDGDFKDWETVPYAHQNPAGEGGTLRSVKTFNSPTHLLFLLEGTLDMKLDPFQMHFDTDNNAATGHNAKDWFPGGSGFEFMYQGMYDWWGELTRFTGATPSSYSFEHVCGYADFFDEYNIQNVEDKRFLEFSIKKDIFGVPLQSVLNFGFREIDPSFSVERGFLPAKAADSKLIPFNLTE